MILKSGDILRVAPGNNNVNGLRSLHRIHDDLRRFRNFGAIKTTFALSSEDPFLGGDLRLYQNGSGKATWTADRMTRCGLLAFLDYINFTPGSDFDALVTVRTWTGFAFGDFNAILQYLPSVDQESDEYDFAPVEFTYILTGTPS